MLSLLYKRWTQMERLKLLWQPAALGSIKLGVSDPWDSLAALCILCKSETSVGRCRQAGKYFTYILAGFIPRGFEVQSYLIINTSRLLPHGICNGMLAIISWRLWKAFAVCLGCFFLNAQCHYVFITVIQSREVILGDKRWRFPLSAPFTAGNKPGETLLWMTLESG